MNSIPFTEKRSRFPVLKAFLRVSGGYLLAVLSASSSFTFLLLAFATQKNGLLGFAFTVLVVAAIVTFVLTLIPATIFSLWSEVRSCRKCRVHVIAGMGLSIIGLLVLSLIGADQPPLQPLFVAAILAAGAVAGRVYWAVSGKHAGNWRHDPTI